VPPPTEIGKGQCRPPPAACDLGGEAIGTWQAGLVLAQTVFATGSLTLTFSSERPAPEYVTSVSGFCPSFRLSPRWHSEVGRKRAEGVLVCANWLSLSCCLLGRCSSSAGLRVLRLLGAIEDMATPRLPMAMGIPLGSHARITRPGSRMAPLSIAHEFGVGEVGGIGVGDGAGGAGVVGDVGRPAGTRRRARL
jgi:hypothetical protein